MEQKTRPAKLWAVLICLAFSQAAAVPTVTSVIAGADMTCTILSDGNVKCWGRNSDGRLGLGDKGYNLGDDPGEMGDNLPTIDLGTDRTAVKVVVSGGWSWTMTCALLDNGQVKCWGDGRYGKLGQGNTEVFFNVLWSFNSSSFFDPL